MIVRAVFAIEDTITLDLEMPDEGFAEGDLLAAAREREPFTDFMHVLDYQEIK